MHGNCLTDLRLARDLGYEGLEVSAAKLKRFLSSGHAIAELAEACRRANVPVTCINALADTEAGCPKAQVELLDECEWWCRAAQALDCPTIQLVFLAVPEGDDWPEARRTIAGLAGSLADVGGPYGVRFQLEPLAWTPFHSLAQAIEVMDAAGRGNLGTVVDFWHLWAGGTQPDEVARLDPAQICGVHICDGKRPAPGGAWVEGELRGYLLGDGDVPIADWVAAVRATGYTGYCSPETFSPWHWELDLYELARDAKARIETYLSPRQRRSELDSLVAGAERAQA
jgi:sugar phosphate isomerase/epimerase